MRPQILSFAGLSLKDFATTEEALGVADAMIKENQDKFGVKPIIEESQYPLLQKHYYVNHLGVKTSVKEGEKRHLQGERDVGRAFKKQMLTYETESEKAVEGVAAAQRVKVESESFEKLQHALNDLKSAIFETIPASRLLFACITSRIRGLTNGISDRSGAVRTTHTWATCPGGGLGEGSDMPPVQEARQSVPFVRGASM